MNIKEISNKIADILGKKENPSFDLASMKQTVDYDAIASILATNVEALKAFEKNYREKAIGTKVRPDNFFEKNSRELSEEARTMDIEAEKVHADDINRAVEYVKRIANALVDKTPIISITDGTVDRPMLPTGEPTGITNEDIASIPDYLRPQLTDELVKKDIDDKVGALMIIANLQKAKNAKTYKERKMFYDMFRQGLDTLDLDPIIYEMLGHNPNSMSHWLPAITEAVKLHGFFKIPKTKIVKVPLPILQLTRLDYNTLNPVTLKIVDEWAMKTFDLDINKTYFIKTGTYSSKFDFRNAKVTGEKEVRELGEYLLFIHHQANMMVSPLNNIRIYGASTTNEWVVREFIEDVENNPTIYKGLPLHTEYRVFVDFDADKFLGISPYWRPDIMKKRFSEGANQSIHDRHDYIIYKTHEDKLMHRYEKNAGTIISEIINMIPDVNLKGQWSIDIMQNGNDFWIIDMATADTSALNDCVDPGMLKSTPVEWLPTAEEIQKALL